MDKIQTNAKINAYLGFAAKTRGLVSGADSVEQALKKGKARLIVLSGDVSSATLERFSFASGAHSVKCVQLTDDALGTLIGKPERKIVCITDKRFAEAIINEINLIDLGDKK